jgi:hypothetical protein
VTTQSADEYDMQLESAWRYLRNLVTAAASEDPDTFRRAILKLQDLDEDAMTAVAGELLYWMLWRRVFLFAGRRPTDEDLERVLDHATVRFSRITTLDRATMKLLLQDIYTTDGEPQGPRGAGFIISGSAILSSILDDPALAFAQEHDPVLTRYRQRHPNAVE